MLNKNQIDLIKQTFGEVVKELRDQHNLSQEKLGFAADLDLTSINEIEKGHRNPKLTTVCKLAKALGVSPSALLKNL